MPNEEHEFPVVLILSAPARHSCKANLILNDVKNLAAGEILGFSLPEVGCMRVETFVNDGPPIAGIPVTGGTVVCKMISSFCDL